MPDFHTLWPLIVAVVGFFVCTQHGVVWNVVALGATASVAFATNAAAEAPISNALLHTVVVALSRVAVYLAVGMAMHLLWLGFRVIRGK